MLKYKTILRDKSILDTTSELEHLHTFENVPASMACTQQETTEDISMNQIWDICKDTGLVQLRELFPLDIVYKFPHNDGIGKVWENHDKALADFIETTNVKRVLEIGAGAGRLGKLYLSKDDTNHWAALEPNHIYEEVVMNNFVHSREWFDENYIIDKDYDAIVHSHVLEHTYNPVSFFKTIHQQIDEDTLHIFSIPDLYYYIKNKFTNGLNFEHTIFLTEDILDTLLVMIGFKIIKKHHHKELPCIFYICKKVEPKNIDYPKSIYGKNKKVFLDFINYYKDEVDELNRKIDEFNGDIFLFGGHIFSQFLIYNGLNTDRIKCILDNSPMKQGNRLYGTQFIVRSPKILKNYKNAAVILKTATYDKEIKEDILSNINSKTKFI
tara:strand:+ start:81 stop:1226 length:1146 start_codon:yes stop_codon:yes gene_type:complete